MAITVNWKKLLVLGLLMLAPFMLAKCGSAGEMNSAEARVGPKGPTTPSKYYFEMATPSIVIQSGGMAYFQVRVWDSLGNVAGGIYVTFSGDFKPTGTTIPSFPTNSDGITGIGIEVKASAGQIMYVTATVEDMSLTIPVQVIANAGGGGAK